MVANILIALFIFSVVETICRKVGWRGPLDLVQWVRMVVVIPFLESLGWMYGCMCGVVKHFYDLLELIKDLFSDFWRVLHRLCRKFFMNLYEYILKDYLNTCRDMCTEVGSWVVQFTCAFWKGFWQYCQTLAPKWASLTLITSLLTGGLFLVICMYLYQTQNWQFVTTAAIATLKKAVTMVTTTRVP